MNFMVCSIMLSAGEGKNAAEERNEEHLVAQMELSLEHSKVCR